MVFVFRSIIPITKTVIVFVGPLVLLYAIAVGLVTYGTITSTFSGNTPGGYFESLISGGSFLSVGIAFFVGISFYLTLNSFILRYGESSDGKVFLSQVWEDIKKEFVHFLGIGAIRIGVYILLAAVFAWTMNMDLGFLGFLVVLIMLYLGVSTSLADVIRMNEGGSVWHALKYSFELVHKSWFPTLGLYLLLGVVNILILLLISFLSGLFSAMFLGLFGSSTIASLFTSFLVLFIIMTLYTGFLSMFWMAGTLQYFNLSGSQGRGSSTEYLIDQIGKNPGDSLF
jgi:hypothetical protein